MPDQDPAPAHRQATWAAVRNFRQRPTVVGVTEHGDTVYEVRSVRLVFPPGSSHFKRLVQCARCAKDLRGSPVLSSEDLDRHPNSAYCEQCSRASPPAVESPAPPAPAPLAVQPRVPDDGSRLAAIEARLAQVTLRLQAPPAVDPQVAALADTVAELRRELRRVASASNDAASEMAAMLDAQRQGLAASLGEGQRALRAELSALARQTRDEAKEINRLIAVQRGEMQEALDDVVQRTLAAVAHPIEGLKERQQALDDRLSERVEVRSEDEVAAAMEGRLAEVEATMAASFEVERRAMADGLRQMRTQVAELTEAVRRAGAEATREALDAVSDPLRDLTGAHRATEDRLDALTAAIDAGASRHHQLEQKLNRSIQRMNRMLETPPEVEPQGSAGAPGKILDALERQLRAAEERLAQR